MVETVQAASECTGIENYNAAVKSVQKRLLEGDNLSHAMAHEALFSYVLYQYITVREQCSVLKRILSAAATQFEDDLDATIQRLVDLIEPRIMVVVACLLGAIILALYMLNLELGAAI